MIGLALSKSPALISGALISYACTTVQNSEGGCCLGNSLELDWPASTRERRSCGKYSAEWKG
jgi:hypothetical protein